MSVYFSIIFNVNCVLVWGSLFRLKHYGQYDSHDLAFLFIYYFVLMSYFKMLLCLIL